MRTAIARVAFAYGCTSLSLSIGWFALVLLGGEPPGVSLGIAIALAMIHGGVLVVTFHREPGIRAWTSVLPVTAGRLRAARVILGAALANFALCLIFVKVAEHRSTLPIYEHGLQLIVASLAVLSSVYITVHWAFRPENLFSRAVLDTAAFPLCILFRRNRRSRRIQ